MLISDEKKIKIAKANKANPYTDITPYELEVSFPIVNYEGFHATKNEILIYVAPAISFKDKERIIGYTGNNAGVSIRLTKSVSVKTGGNRATPIRSTVRQSNLCDLLITNKRVIFIGKDDSFEFKIEKISTMKLLDKNSFVIQSGQKSKNIWLDSSLISYAYSFINYVINQNSEGKDLYFEIKNTNNNITPEQIELCKTVQKKCSELKLPKDKYTEQWETVKKLWIFVGVLFASIILLISVTNKHLEKKNTENNIPNNYTLEQVLNLENVPKLFDSYEETNNFFDNIDNIQVLTIQEHSQIERNLKKTTDDCNLIYFIKNSTHENYIGTLQINLFNKIESYNMTIDKAIKLLCSFLPRDFFKYYSKDVSFKYTNNNCTVYTYSCRINENGIKFHNSGHFEYPSFYSFYIIHYESTNQWKLETDYSAYGNKGLDWIQKYSSKWEIDYKNYMN